MTKKTIKNMGMRFPQKSQNTKAKKLLMLALTSAVVLFNMSCPAAATAPDLSLICPDGTPFNGTGEMPMTVACSACNEDEGFELVGTQCRRLSGEFTRVGMTAKGFGLGSELSQLGDLASIDDTLYLLGRAPNTIYTLDTDTGTAARIITDSIMPGFNVGENVPTGLARDDDDNLYMVGEINISLYTLGTTPDTADMAVQVGTTPRGFGVAEVRMVERPSGLASIGDTLYMVTAFRSPALYTISTSGDTAGMATRVGSATEFGVGETNPYGLASIGNVLYMAGRSRMNNGLGGQLYAVNTKTGVATPLSTDVSSFGVGENAPTGLASIGNTLYMVGVDNAILYKATLE